MISRIDSCPWLKDSAKHVNSVYGSPACNTASYIALTGPGRQ